MAAPAETAVDRGPGNLIVTPTDLSAAAPYGGTYLGAARDIESDFLDDEDVIVPGEEFAGAPVEALEMTGCFALYSLIRGFDATALATIFPNTSTGSSSGAKVIDGGVQSTVRSGHLRSSRAVKLLFAPLNSAKRAVLIYKAMPFIPKGARARYSILYESVIPVVWLALPDTANSGRTYKIGKIADLTL